MDSLNIGERLTRIEKLLLGNKAVLDFEEVASYTGLSKSHLYKLTSSGGIPCYKPSGKRIYFDKLEIDSWLLSNKKLSNEELAIMAENHLLKGGKS
jgi:excisionase family DNA binding protein